MFSNRITRFFKPQSFYRCYSSLVDPIVVTNDGSTIVCWHPEKPYPYEFTKPLPHLEEVKTTSVLQNTDPLRNIRKEKQEFVVQDLAKMTYTTKHRWFPRNRDRKAKRTPKDREFL